MSHKIVITDPVRLRAAIEFADKQGCLAQFGTDLCNLLRVLTGGMIASYGEGECNPVPTSGTETAEIGYDWAPMSFSFAIWRNSEVVHRPDRSKLVMNGGFVYSGPGVPADGSFPSLTVSLDDVTGHKRPLHTWRCHT